MASSSSSLTHTRRYHVFPSFHGQDVRKTFLSHVHHCFASKGIIMFKDHEIKRGHTIGPELVQAIRESRVSIVVLSKKYASSSWCLDELVEIFNCEEAFGQVVMTIFYDVDPSDVRKQIGDFGEVFEKTCEGKTEEVKQRWSQALAHIATIAGEHSLNWANEAEMIQKIATDVSNKLNLTPSRDFEGMVGLEAHLNKLDTLLCLWCDDVVKIIGIWGPAGIGKTTIARALYDQLSARFQLRCFMGNLKGSCKSLMGSDDYDFQLCLQSQLLSKIFNQRDMKVDHLGKIKEWLQDQGVLIILDAVDDLKQLETLAKEPSWFGFGSRIIVTTEDKRILKAHGIQNIYHVGFPSCEEAVEIFCLYAFKQRSVREGFQEVAYKIATFCGKLPLALRVVGSSLRGESKEEWELQLSRIESSVDREIEDVLRVGYDRLSKKNQSLFLHIASFFNYGVDSYVISMLSDSNLDVRNGLKTLEDRSLVRSDWGWGIRMHDLLEQLGRQIVFEQSNEPGKRQFLVGEEEIYDVLTNETGTESVIGISLTPYDKMGKVSISKGAFDVMPNLRFLRIYSSSEIPEDMDYIPRLRLLHWNFYPRKSLPLRFQPNCLVELTLTFSRLEKLWGGIQPLPNLKTIDLSYSYKLKEIPNLSKATNLEILELFGCEILVELPSSISNLHKLKKLYMRSCKKLKVIPANINLASLEEVYMSHCSKLRKFPDISTNIVTLDVSHTKIKEVPPSIVGWSRLKCLKIGSKSLKRLTNAPLSITSLDLSNSDIKSIPDCVTSLPYLLELSVRNCPKLLSIPTLGPSLQSLYANDCVSLKRVCCSFQKSTKTLRFGNCFKLDEESRRRIIQQSIDSDGYIWLPGKEIPAEFTHRTTGSSVTIPLAPGSFSASSTFKACIQNLSGSGYSYHDIRCNIKSNGDETHFSMADVWSMPPDPTSEHLFIRHGNLFCNGHKYHETISEITFEFSYTNGNDKNIECGVEIKTEEAEGSSSSTEVDIYEIHCSCIEVESYEIKGNNNHHTDGDGDGDYENKDDEAWSECYNYETESSSTKVDCDEIRGNNSNHADSDGYGDGDYETKGSTFCQVESTKTSKRTHCWSWLRKLGLKKKIKTTEWNPLGIS